MTGLPGFVDVNTDLQIASPQVMVNIDRDRALSLGVSPQQIQDALMSSYGNRQVSLIYQPSNEYQVIAEVAVQGDFVLFREVGGHLLHLRHG